MKAELVEVIRSVGTVGEGEAPDDPVHEHVRFHTKDGTLVAEECSMSQPCKYYTETYPEAEP